LDGVVKQYCPTKGTNLVLLEGINNIRETFIAILNFNSRMVKACMVLSINPTKSQELISILVTWPMIAVSSFAARTSTEEEVMLAMAPLYSGPIFLKLLS